MRYPSPLLALCLTFCLALSCSSSASAEKQPRLIVLAPHAVEMIFEIGAGDTIIGTVEYADYPNEANQIRRIGRYDFIDYEAVMLLQPDAIIVNTSTTSAPMQTRLKELGFTLIDSSVSELKQIPQRLLELGDITGQQQEAKRSAEKFESTLAGIKSQYQDLARIDLFYQVWPAPLTTTASSWMNEIFVGCGANNVFADSVSEYPQVSLEQVLSSTPEMIIKPIYHGNSNQEAINWVEWPEIPAVANEQIITIEGDLVHRTGPRVLKGMQQVCEKVAQARAQKQSQKQSQKLSIQKAAIQ
ncbi:periplasmic binding protein [Shewanella sediminis HAW-EB3]|uniref:Periplasmic binding protein n=1 Tax=Shewanella sediminis (strain HAW-EB3) TaxID=425104 RepID=A8FV97_SHESH|nr:cobalamin-binding protein [Shewanella sediminis]ABV36770.1 periplasmic binding protein [Shewanella sediminis HAW-EB3]